KLFPAISILSCVHRVSRRASTLEEPARTVGESLGGMNASLPETAHYYRSKRAQELWTRAERLKRRVRWMWGLYEERPTPRKAGINLFVWKLSLCFFGFLSFIRLMGAVGAPHSNPPPLFWWA